MLARRKRRRAVRPSEAKDYDRTADRPPFQSAFDSEGRRTVVLEEDAAEEPATGLEFYIEQMPPHYGRA